MSQLVPICLIWWQNTEHFSRGHQPRLDPGGMFVAYRWGYDRQAATVRIACGPESTGSVARILFAFAPHAPLLRSGPQSNRPERIGRPARELHKGGGHV